MSTFTTSMALQVVNAALAEAHAKGFKPMAVVVVDAAGQIKASARDDGATALRHDIALGKACAAIGMGSSSRVLTERAKQLPAFFGAISATAQQPFIPQTGAVLVRNAAGDIVGAAGASGGTGDEDEVICIAGVLAAGLRTD